jgi:predicted nucleic-acid-binding Zn-ribbon protein
MKVNVNHPSFISFLETVSNNILSSVSIENYFSLPQEKKMSVLYVVFKLLKNSVKTRAKLTDMELKSFIVVLCKKHEEVENYEFAAVLRDISNNFDAINDFVKPTKKTTRTIKTDKNNNG